MYLNIGGDTIINSENIVGIFDLDNCTVTKKGRDFINNNTNNIVTVSFDELPKSFIIYNDEKGDKLYICQYQSSVLLKRIKQNLI